MNKDSNDQQLNQIHLEVNKLSIENQQLHSQLNKPVLENKHEKNHQLQSRSDLGFKKLENSRNQLFDEFEDLQDKYNQLQDNYNHYWLYIRESYDQMYDFLILIFLILI